jgi:hypothetical protein
LINIEKNIFTLVQDRNMPESSMNEAYKDESRTIGSENGNKQENKNYKSNMEAIMK